MGPLWFRLALGAVALGGTVGLFVASRGRRLAGYHIRSVCPRCREDLHLQDGPNRCPRCDLRINIDVRD